MIHFDKEKILQAFSNGENCSQILKELRYTFINALIESIYKKISRSIILNDKTVVISYYDVPLNGIVDNYVKNNPNVKNIHLLKNNYDIEKLAFKSIIDEVLIYLYNLGLEPYIRDSYLCLDVELLSAFCNADKLSILI